VATIGKCVTFVKILCLLHTSLKSAEKHFGSPPHAGEFAIVFLEHHVSILPVGQQEKGANSSAAGTI